MDYDTMVRQSHDELFRALPASFGKAETDFIEKAYLLAEEAHRPQKRSSGLPYILHPLAVALVVVTEMRQKDVAIICAALLHDVVEDTPYTIEDIKDRFGEDVAFLVGSVTKPNKAQVDNFQHILGSVHDDIRVLILKLSDRLHNMRTLAGLRPQKQWKIASETQFFFAPLAGRLGLYNVKSELENLAFKFLNPSEYDFLVKALEEDRERTRNSVESFMKDASETVGREFDGAVHWDIRYRKPFSIWREMQERSCDFYHVPFKHYIRAVFNIHEAESATGQDLTEQYVVLRIYSILAGAYREQTGSFVNYMAQPKANGYRSVHFRMLNPFGGIEEFHIGSDSMREQSYFGCVVEGKEQWLKRLTSVLKELSEDRETLMPGIHDSLYNEDIVVYTLDSKPVTLPKGASALDFAYAIHTAVGMHAKYARINGRLASVKSCLKRADCVEIVTDENVRPKTDWLDVVVSYKAKKNIQAYLNRQPKLKYILCPHCNPMPGSEIIGFSDAQGSITIHSRNCPHAIRMASEKGHTIVAVDDFFPDDSILYPVRIQVVCVDRYHLLSDIIECITEGRKLSMTSLTTYNQDEVVSCDISFSVHSATELSDTIAGISSIKGVEEVRRI
ncbi:MAG: HD domain-containing protein [Candidatus Cryptobacteroides sp.]